MANESPNQASGNQRRSRRTPVAGVAVLLVVGSAVALPMMTDCNPIKGSSAGGTEPMELWGRWLGMMLASADSAAARSVGIPAGVAGVVVADVARDATSRVAQAGLAPGDVIVKVDGTTTSNLADLYTLTTRLNTARSLPLEVLRQGQPMTVLLPAPMMAAPQQPIAMQSQPAATWNTPAQPAAPQVMMPQPVFQPVAPQPAVPQPAVPQPIAPQATAAVALPPVSPVAAPTAAAMLSPTNAVPGAMGR